MEDKTMTMLETIFMFFLSSATCLAILHEDIIKFFVGSDVEGETTELSDVKGKTTKFFAHGIFKSINLMLQTCPDAVFIGDYELQDHRRDPRIGVSNVLPQEGASVAGKLYEICEECEAKLDVIEGVPHFYQKHYTEDGIMFYRLNKDNPESEDFDDTGDTDWDEQDEIDPTEDPYWWDEQEPKLEEESNYCPYSVHDRAFQNGVDVGYRGK